MSRKEAHGKMQKSESELQKNEEVFFNLEGVVMTYSWVILRGRPLKTLMNLFGENICSHLGITGDGL